MAHPCNVCGAAAVAMAPRSTVSIGTHAKAAFWAFLCDQHLRCLPVHLRAQAREETSEERQA
jgi:hypothetical protein